MKSFASFFLFCLPFLILQSCTVYKKDYNDEANKYAHDFILVDGHIDLPYRLSEMDEDIAGHASEGDFDYKRATDGGLNAPFMSIYIPSEFHGTSDPMSIADSLIGAVKKLATNNPDKFAIATSPQQIQQQFKKGIISLPMGLESDTPVGNDLNNIQTLYDKGIRYINLTHHNETQFDSTSGDSAQSGGSLSNFEKQMIQKMNQIGMIIDVSQVSDSAFFDILNTTKAPVIASHSSARYFTPQFESNLSDTMITALAKNNGVMMINFGSNFISDSSRVTADTLEAHLQRWLKENNKEESDPEAQEYLQEYRERNYYYAKVQDVADHIDHVANLAGIDYVALGSSFDGVGNTLPEGLKDVSDYPNLIRVLLDRGYTKDDIRKICYENIFRVWNDVAAKAQTLSAQNK